MRGAIRENAFFRNRSAGKTEDGILRDKKNEKRKQAT
jgi:hypothetical protein